MRIFSLRASGISDPFPIHCQLAIRKIHYVPTSLSAHPLIFSTSHPLFPGQPPSPFTKSIILPISGSPHCSISQNIASRAYKPLTKVSDHLTILFCLSAVTAARKRILFLYFLKSMAPSLSNLKITLLPSVM